MAKVYAFMAEGLEEVECLATVDILIRAGVEVVLVSISKTLKVNGTHNITLMADELFEETSYGDGDLFFLPGGMPGADNLNNHGKLKELLKQMYSKGKRLAAICAAPIVLGELHLLEGKRATCYPGYEDRLLGAVLVPDGVVTDGLITTARGLGYAFDLGLELVTILVNEKVSQEIKKGIQYN